MTTNFNLKTFKRLSNSLRKDSFIHIDHSSDDYIITENYEYLGKPDINVNISSILGLDLQDERYVIFRYGKDLSKEEKSCFHSIKGSDFKYRKCDITLLIFDKKNEEVLLVCGEVKRTLKESNFADARQQLISSFIDLNIFNVLMTFNHFPVKTHFFIVYLDSKILTQKPHNSSASLAKTRTTKPIPYGLVREEYFKNIIYYGLDDLDYIFKEIEVDIDILNREKFMQANLSLIKGEEAGNYVS